MLARLGAAHQSIGADDIVTFDVADDQMVAKRIELVDIETGRVGALQSLIEFQVKNLEAQTLRFDDLSGIAGDSNCEISHAAKYLTHSRQFENQPVETHIANDGATAAAVSAKTPVLLLRHRRC